MSEEEFRKIAKEYAEMYFTKGIDSAKIFNYVGELEMKVEQLESIRKEAIEELSYMSTDVYVEDYDIREKHYNLLMNILNKGGIRQNER